MKLTMKHIFALVLTLALMLSVVPMGFAQEDYAASVNGTGYTTVAAAVAAANGKVVKLLKNSDEQVSVKGDLYLDLNGCTLAGITMTSGTLYGMDSTTDDYNCTDGYGQILNVTGNCAKEHKTSITGVIRRYLAVNEGGKVSFHRFYLGLTHATIRTNGKGVGYKAVFAGDSVVKAQLNTTEAFGYTLQLEGSQPVSVWKPASQFQSLKTVTLLVKDFDATQYGEADLSATVQVKFDDGTQVTTNAYTTTFKAMMETVNATYTTYTEEQIAALAAWIHEAPIMKQWDTGNIVPKEEEEPTGLTIKAQSVTVDKGTGEVTVDVMVYNNPGIMTATITVEVDDDIIGFKKATKSGYDSLYLTAPGSKQKESPYNFLLDGMELTDDDKVDGTLFTITFTIKDTTATGTYDIVLSYVEGDITDENYESLEVTMVNGSITIK